MAAIWILSLLLLFITALMFVPMQFGIRYEKTAVLEKLHIYVSLFGILIRIPIHTNKEEQKQKNTKKEKTKSEKKLTYASFRENVSALKQCYDVAKDELFEMLSYVRKHLSCKEVDFKVAFGLDDAAKTGIATGAVWTSGTLLLKILDNLIGIQKITMNVYPDFNQKKFDIFVKTILIMQPFRFIIIIRNVKRTINFIQNKFNQM